ncbi:MAG: hypothetical protein JXA91_00605 [Candidatus Thermoplasmatota archaeon]|nr:hypothetical protein [Candidatus Thermoplasmatota archaeon]
MKGEIAEVDKDRLEAHRKRLISIAQREEMKDLIAAAPNDEWVIKVRSGQKEYDYIASALGIIVRSVNIFLSLLASGRLQRD